MRSDKSALLMGRLEWMKTRRYPIENTVQEISQLCMPFRGDITSRNTDGRRISGVFDSTAMLAADQFVQWIMGVLLPKSTPWLRLTHQRQDEMDPNMQHAVQGPLDRASFKILGWLARSNFYVEAQTMVRDFSVLGNSTMYIEEDAPTLDDYGNEQFGGFCFKAIPFRDMWWATGRKNRPIMSARMVEMPSIEAVRFFRNPGRVAQNNVSHAAMEPVSYYHLVFKNEKETTGGLKFKTDKAWVSVWVDADDFEILDESGYDETPYVISRWEVMAGDEYGRGRGNIARVSAKGVNEIQRQSLNAMAFNLQPRLIAPHEGVFNLGGGPGTVMTMRSEGAGQLLPQYLNSGADFNAAEMWIRRDQEQIQRAFLQHLIGEPETQDRSAFASQLRQQRTIQAMAGSSNPVETDFFQPLTDSIVSIAYQAGHLDEIDEVAAITGERVVEVGATFMSPFFTAQRSSIGQRARQSLLELAEIVSITGDVSYLDGIDPDATRDVMLRYSDSPAEIKRSPEEVVDVRARREQQQQAQATLQALEQGSKVLKNVGGIQGQVA